MLGFTELATQIVAGAHHEGAGTNTTIRHSNPTLHCAHMTPLLFHLMLLSHHRRGHPIYPCFVNLQ